MVDRLEGSCVHADHESFAKTLSKDGFFLWHALIPDTAIDDHLAECEIRLRDGSEGALCSPISGDWYFDHAPTAKLIFNPSLLSFLRCWFGAEPVADRPSTGMYSRGAIAHRDSDNFVTQPRGGRVRVWVALEDVHPHAGPVYFVPQSHRLISTSIEDAVLAAHPELRAIIEAHRGASTLRAFREDTRSWQQYEHEMIEQQIRDLRLPRVIPSMKKGDVIVFDVDVVHGSIPCVNKALTRKHMIMFWASSEAHFYDCRVWWQPDHSYRCRENALRVATVPTTHGSRFAWSTRDMRDDAWPSLVRGRETNL